MTRLTVSLTESERDALKRLAFYERREPRDQAALIIRRALIENGLLTGDAGDARKADATQSGVQRADAST